MASKRKPARPAMVAVFYADDKNGHPSAGMMVRHDSIRILKVQERYDIAMEVREADNADHLSRIQAREKSLMEFMRDRGGVASLVRMSGAVMEIRWQQHRAREDDRRYNRDVKAGEWMPHYGIGFKPCGDDIGDVTRCADLLKHLVKSNQAEWEKSESGLVPTLSHTDPAGAIWILRHAGIPLYAWVPGERYGDSLLYPTEEDSLPEFSSSVPDVVWGGARCDSCGASYVRSSGKIRRCDGCDKLRCNGCQRHCTHYEKGEGFNGCVAIGCVSCFGEAARCEKHKAKEVADVAQA